MERVRGRPPTVRRVAGDHGSVSALDRPDGRARVSGQGEHQPRAMGRSCSIPAPAGRGLPVVLFLPAAGSRLPGDWPVLFRLAGPGHQPHDPAIKSIDDLVQLVVARLDEPVDLVAQSMGGVIAAHVALAHPALVRRLVLCVTSGGVDMTSLGAGDWRPDYRKSFPKAATWITAGKASPPLPVENIKAPTLLIWGDADPISPVAVGCHLEGRLPTQLHVVPGGDRPIWHKRMPNRRRACRGAPQRLRILAAQQHRLVDTEHGGAVVRPQPMPLARRLQIVSSRWHLARSGTPERRRPARAPDAGPCRQGRARTKAGVVTDQRAP